MTMGHFFRSVFSFLLISTLIFSVTPSFAERTTTYFHHDKDGSVVAATDEQGKVVWRKDYAAFGEQVSGDKTNEAISYTGKQYDDKTGLIYFGARYYDPEIGRFISRDPEHVLNHIEKNPHMFNRYTYANNNPYRYVDPDGRAPRDLRNDHMPLSLSDTIDEMLEGGGAFGGRGARGDVKLGDIWKALTGKPKVAKKAPEITKPYKRPSGATTKAQRESVQGKPCVDCGARTPKQYADHKEPLVKEYYRTGAIDKTRMRDIDSVQPQCPTCSNKQGGELSKYSKEQKKDLGL
ncbi:RHS repeat-associated core domain-containing protein [Teredinibacter sp. KSP-S5-2]|uniref:RHS repeat domain-containing protein n=1 Tax=Teredinibacter sp. KSP-S5-2 TaxID=3034506 RepID=UPI002934209A|nr:RHS repeat-associated core domain-containing protein [Teredinibacter sp. KSP-S5-2]WNO10387.1 RHS repeat-associated core domain-containing protein [Teredinibacter sp. KSP-S5-2]